MEIPHLHSWVKSPQEAINLQKELARQVRLQPPAHARYRLVAGADVSTTLAARSFWAAVLVLRLPDFELVEEAYAEQNADFPYIPGLLSFREIPVLLKALHRLKTVPDLVLCDGQGLAHPRFFGLACHLGLWLNLPTIGCAKTKLVGNYVEPGPNLGDWSPLEYQDRIVGVALRTRQRSRPIFVSPGHLMDLELALKLVQRCCGKARLPEPIRLAHLAVNRYRKES